MVFTPSLQLYFIIAISIYCASCNTAKKNAAPNSNGDQKDTLNKLKKKELVTRVMSKPDDCSIVSESGDEVFVHYTGYLEDGKIFDSSEKLNRDPISFKIGEGTVILGWEKGLLNMCVNERRRLVIPPELAYGKSGFPPVIPPDATLMFEVTLVNLRKKNFSNILTDPMEHTYILKLLAAPLVVVYILYYLYRKYRSETQEAREMKRSKKHKKNK